MNLELDQIPSDDHVLYSNFAQPASCPDRMALVAQLQGLRHAPLTSCRVLELGCADGGNLLPIAEAMSDASFVGIDLRPENTEKVTQLASQLNLTNVRAIASDIRDVGNSLGKFDYVICHGVFSWVEPEVQDGIVQAIHDLLDTDGLAYLNYNTVPGSLQGSILRDYLAVSVDRTLTVKERIQAGRTALGLMSDAFANRNDHYATAMRDQITRLKQVDDSFLFHGYLDVHNRTMTFGQMLELLDRHGLRYIADTRWPLVARECGIGIFSDRLPQHRLDREQVLDFFDNRSARSSLIGHAREYPAASTTCSSCVGPNR